MSDLSNQTINSPGPQGHALVIGAGGGIASAVVEQLVASGQYQSVVAVSRHPAAEHNPGSSTTELVWYVADSADEVQIEQFVAECTSRDLRFRTVICCIGCLHNERLQPEKKLTDMRSDTLLEYMHINAVMPALWLRALPPVIDKNQPSHLVCLSARVGSIADNRLGGWYGYRASKSALNMLLCSAQVEYRRRLKQAILVSYHPGTVDTPLSKPFQRNVKANTLLTAEQTAQKLLALLPGLGPEQAPYYIDYAGKSIPW